MQAAERIQTAERDPRPAVVQTGMAEEEWWGLADGRLARVEDQGLGIWPRPMGISTRLATIGTVVREIHTATGRGRYAFAYQAAYRSTVGKYLTGGPVFATGAEAR